MRKIFLLPRNADAKLLYTLCILSLFMCSACGVYTSSDPIEALYSNYKPQLMEPSDGAVGVSVPTVFRWNVDNLKEQYTYLNVSSEPFFDSADSIGVYLGGGSKSVDTLQRGKKYYWAVTAVNVNGISNTSEIRSFTTKIPGCNNVSSVTYGGKIYHTVAIGYQCWLKENLNIGAMRWSSSSADSMRDDGVIEKYCYDNDTVNCNLYGGLYQWGEAMQYSKNPGAQGICPSGWHIPTSAEFKILGTTVNQDGNNLKAIGQGSGGGIGTDSSGFSALLSGYRVGGGGYFYGFGQSANFVGSNEPSVEPNKFEGLILEYSMPYFEINSEFKIHAFGVRCLKD